MDIDRWLEQRMVGLSPSVRAATRTTSDFSSTTASSTRPAARSPSTPLSSSEAPRSSVITTNPPASSPANPTISPTTYSTLFSQAQTELVSTLEAISSTNTIDGITIPELEQSTEFSVIRGESHTLFVEREGTTVTAALGRIGPEPYQYVLVGLGFLVFGFLLSVSWSIWSVAKFMFSMLCHMGALLWRIVSHTPPCCNGRRSTDDAEAMDVEDSPQLPLPDTDDPVDPTTDEDSPQDPGDDGADVSSPTTKEPGPQNEENPAEPSTGGQQSLDTSRYESARSDEETDGKEDDRDMEDMEFSSSRTGSPLLPEGPELEGMYQDVMSSLTEFDGSRTPLPEDLDDAENNLQSINHTENNRLYPSLPRELSYLDPTDILPARLRSAVPTTPPVGILSDSTMGLTSSI